MRSTEYAKYQRRAEHYQQAQLWARFRLNSKALYHNPHLHSEELSHLILTPKTTCDPPTQPAPTNLKFPEEIQPCSGFHLLGMQVQCQDKDSNDDRGHNLQRHSCGHWGAAAKERAELPCYWKNTASPRPTLPTLGLNTLPGKGFFFSFPSKLCCQRDKQYLQNAVDSGSWVPVFKGGPGNWKCNPTS